MSDLQLALLALGAVIIAGVLLYNWWQERRLIREASRGFDRMDEDTRLDDFHIGEEAVAAAGDEESPSMEEPAPAEQPMAEAVSLPMDEEPAADEREQLLAAWDEAPEATLPEEMLPEEMPELTAIAPETAVVSRPVAAMSLPASFDPRVDLVALIHLASPRSGATLRSELQPLPEFDRHTQWLGQDEAGGWQFLTADREGTSFVAVACALQLADRSGPVSGNTLRDFQIKVEYLAANLGAEVEWLGEADPRQQAVELDQFCIGVDVTVGLHVMQAGNGPFTGTKLRGLAEAGGMRLYDDGKYHYENDAGETLFTLADQDGRPFTVETLRTAFVRGINLQLDIPRASRCLETFSQMALFARQLENGLRGKLVDDNQHELGDADIEKIRQQLKAICTQMIARGIEPGSPTALRLFS